MNFPILLACFLIPLLATGDEIPKSNRFRCGSSAMKPPQRGQSRFPRSHSIQDDQQFVPYKILYLIDDTIDPVEFAKLEMATDYANRRLSKAIKARKLADVRFRNRDPQCNESCSEIPFPKEYVLPCSSSTKPEEATGQIKQLNEANYTMVVRILVYRQGVSANRRCTYHSTIAFARSCDLALAELSQGPHHGYIVLCRKPSSMTNDGLRDIVLHETLHVLMPYGLSGIGANNYECETKEDCKNKTWKEVKRWAKNEQGQPTEITTAIAIGPLFEAAAKTHFGCDTAEGIDLHYKIFDRSTMEIKIDRMHWSEHLFPDEVMAPIDSTLCRFSLLTLSALASHVKWYEVDLSQAEPLVSSEPSKEFACDVAQKSCFEILKEQTGVGVKFIRPFCDIREGTDRVITSHCSPDHQRQLSCEDALGDSGCAFLIGTRDHIYDTDVCANATSMKSDTLASQVGASFGPGTICITTTNFPPWESHKTNALCLHHECHADILVLKFSPSDNDYANCYVTCTKDQSNQLLTVNWCNDPEHEVTIICPDYDQVCKRKSTESTTTSSTVPITTTTTTTTSVIPSSVTSSHQASTAAEPNSNT